MIRSQLWWRFAAAAVLLAPVLAAAGVSVRFDPGSTATTPFPSDRFTVREHPGAAAR